MTEKTTELQAAIIKAGLDKITFGNAETSLAIPIAELPDSSLLSILTYGKRKANDYVNAAAKEARDSDKPENKEDLLEAWISKAKAGTLGLGNTGSRLAPLDRIKRDLVIDLLLSIDMKRKQASKLAVEFDDAFQAHYLPAKLAQAGLEPTEANISLAYQKYRPILIDQPAEKILAAQKGDEITISL